MGIDYRNMGLPLNQEQLREETTPSQRKAISRLTGFGEFPVQHAELSVRGLVHIKVRGQWSEITPRGKVTHFG